VHTGFGGKTEGKRLFGRPSRGCVRNIKPDVNEVEWGVWTGLIWLRIGRVCGHLWMRWWYFEFHKMREISWLTDKLLASQEANNQFCFLMIGTVYLLTVWTSCHIFTFSDLCDTSFPGAVFYWI
jgi:hypothetical protein